MLGEYAEFPLFDTVGIDAAFYRPLSPATYRSYAEVLPPGFRCVQKVWNRVTVHTFTGHQDGGTAGERNPDFLNAELCVNEVIGPAQEHFAGHLGPLVFEIQAIGAAARIDATRFAELLDRFFERLPADRQYALECRNPEHLTPPYFATLREHGVAHVFNSWTRMPPIGHQLDLPGAISGPFILARALLRPGRTYDEAVDAFAPYDRIREPNPKLRNDLARLVQRAGQMKVPAYLLVNNRAEGSAPLTIAAVVEMLADADGK
jgi:uncharacterized protein YecE (DUF72 family)